MHAWPGIALPPNQPRRETTVDSKGNIHQLPEEEAKKLQEMWGLEAQKERASHLERLVAKLKDDNPDLVPIPPEEETTVQAMNRKQRRAWYKQRRKELRRQK